MIRIGGILLLFITVFFMVREISETWKDKPTFTPPETSSRQDGKSPEVTEAPPFNPEVPTTPPELKEGYLFNEGRLLEEKKPEAPKPEEHPFTANDLGIQTDIDSVTYSGSLITDTYKMAIVTYVSKPVAEPASKSKRRTARRRKPAKSKSASETVKLMEGDLISGYLVANIGADKIIFRKEDQSIEKYIYDPNKKRVTPKAKSRELKAPPRPKPGAVPGAIPSAPAPPPSSATSTTVGGAKPAAAAIKKPIARKPTSTRRMVISRKPPAKPDTSRVSRRRRTGGSAVGATPTGPPVPPMGR